MSETRKTLYQKLAAIRKMIDKVSKNESGYNYKYADINEILAKVRAGMDNQGVSLIPKLVNEQTSIEPVTIVKSTWDKANNAWFDKKAQEVLAKSPMIFVWVDDETGETLEVPWYMAAQMEDAAQAVGAGLTYTTRQFLVNYFQIPQSDDVEKLRTKKLEAEQAERENAAHDIVTALYPIVSGFTAEHPERRDDVVAFMKQYTKDGNYLKITNPQLAEKLADDFHKKFVNAN